MSARKAFGGAGASAILEQCAVNDLAVERRAHGETRAQLADARAQVRPAYLKGVFVGACFGALPFLVTWLVWS